MGVNWGWSCPCDWPHRPSRCSWKVTDTEWRDTKPWIVVSSLAVTGQGNASPSWSVFSLMLFWTHPKKASKWSSKQKETVGGGGGRGRHFIVTWTIMNYFTYINTTLLTLLHDTWWSLWIFPMSSDYIAFYCLWISWLVVGCSLSRI